MTVTFIDVLEQLEKTTGTNDKIDILQKNKDVAHLKEYLDYATDPKITFGVAQISDTEFVSDLYDWVHFKAVLDRLSDRSLTGNAAQGEINNLLAYTSPVNKKWFQKCLLKDLASIGLGLRLLEKGFGEVKKFRLMLAAPEDELDKVPDEEGYLDKKANGVRTIVFIENGKVIAIYGGRNGLIAENFYFIVEEIEALVDLLGLGNVKDLVLDGEVHVNDCLEDTMSLYGFKRREQDHFIGAKGKIKEKAWADYQEDEKRIDAFKADAKFTIFDVIPLANWEKQSFDRKLVDRKKDLEILDEKIKELKLKRIEIIESVKVPNKAAGIEEAQKWIARGFEGGIYKIASGIYEWKRSRNWVKIKEVVDFEIQFTGYEIQKDKYNPDGTLKPPMIGKVIGVDAGGNEYRVGTGKALDEDVRKRMLDNWDTEFNGKIGTCSAQRPSDKGKYICPRLDIIRLDRSDLDG